VARESGGTRIGRDANRAGRESSGTRMGWAERSGLRTEYMCRECFAEIARRAAPASDPRRNIPDSEIQARVV